MLLKIATTSSVEVNLVVHGYRIRLVGDLLYLDVTRYVLRGFGRWLPVFWQLSHAVRRQPAHARPPWWYILTYIHCSEKNGQTVKNKFFYSKARKRLVVKNKILISLIMWRGWTSCGGKVTCNVFATVFNVLIRNC